MCKGIASFFEDLRPVRRRVCRRTRARMWRKRIWTTEGHGQGGRLTLIVCHRRKTKCSATMIIVGIWFRGSGIQWAWQRQDALAEGVLGSPQKRYRIHPAGTIVDWTRLLCGQLQFSRAATLYQRLIMTTYKLATFYKLNADGSSHFRSGSGTKRRANRLTTFCTRWRKLNSRPSLKLEEIGETEVKRIGAPYISPFCTTV